MIVVVTVVVVVVAVVVYSTKPLLREVARYIVVAIIAM